MQDWSDCARTVITRRDQLIRLGIGKRRPRKSDVQPPPNVTPVVATPVPPPVASDTASTNPALVGVAQTLALPPKSNGATPGSNGASVNGGSHA